MTPTEIRLQLHALGYSPIPIRGKRPILDGWQTKHITNTDEIRLWEKVYPYDTNTGDLTRTTPLFDIDVLFEECAEAIRPSCGGFRGTWPTAHPHRLGPQARTSVSHRQAV